MIKKYLITVAIFAILSNKVLATCEDKPGDNMDWSDCIKRDVNIANIQIHNGKFVNTTFLGVTKFTNVKMNGVDFTGSSIDEIDFIDSQLMYTTFNKVKSKSLLLINNSRLDSFIMEAAELDRLMVCNSVINTSLLNSSIKQLEWKGNRTLFATRINLTISQK